MGSGAPSRQSQALAQAKQTVDIDPTALAAQIPPQIETSFSTAIVRTDMDEEERDGDGNITTPASLTLEFVGLPVVAQIGNQVTAMGGHAYRTSLKPAFAVEVLAAALAEAEAALASMQEQPVKSSIPIASSMADVAVAAEQAAAVEQDIKGGQ